MVSVVSVVGLAFIVVVHTFIAAVATRFFRLRLATRWGSLLYTLLLVPVLLVASTLVLSGVIGLGSNVGGVGTALIVAVVLPLMLGYAIDIFWMPAPDEIKLPKTPR